MSNTIAYCATSHPNQGAQSLHHDAANAVPGGGAAPLGIIVIERRVLLRESVAHCISTRCEDAALETVGDEHDILSDNADLIILGMQCSDDCTMIDLRSKIARLKERFDSAPIVLMLDTDDTVFIGKLTPLGIAGVFSANAGIDFAIAAIRFAMAGGHFAFGNSQSIIAPRQESLMLPTECVPEIGHHDDRFTKRECEVITLLREGLQNKLIAYRVGISESTVKVHLRHIMKKLNARNRTQALFLMQRSAISGRIVDAHDEF